MSNIVGLLFPHSLATDGVMVRVAVSFLADQSDPVRGRWFWSYHIRIENQRADAVQLISRRWLITDGRGDRHRVEGEGVVGAQPRIDPGAAYDYVSGCPLDTSSGSMEGGYRMLNAAGERFEVRIPRFPLRGPSAR